MIQQLSRFVNTGAGLEKTLRMIQCVSQLGAALTLSSALTVQLTTVKLQLALGKFRFDGSSEDLSKTWHHSTKLLTLFVARRYFRFFGFIDSFQRVSALLGQDGFSSMNGFIDLAKWTCFGLYFVLDNLTIVCFVPSFPPGVAVLTSK